MEELVTWAPPVPLWWFRAIAERDGPDGTHVLRKMENARHFVLDERADERGAEALMDRRDEDQHRGEGAVGDAVEVDTSPSIFFGSIPGDKVYVVYCSEERRVYERFRAVSDVREIQQSLPPALNG